jgi:arsenate reductase-like glutaredoxin family protein
METIIIKSRDSKKTKAVLDFLKKNRLKADIYHEPSKDEILDTIEKGAKEVAAFLKGRKKLKNAKDLLREL